MLHNVFSKQLTYTSNSVQIGYSYVCNNVWHNGSTVFCDCVMLEATQDGSRLKPIMLLKFSIMVWSKAS